MTCSGLKTTCLSSGDRVFDVNAFSGSCLNSLPTFSYIIGPEPPPWWLDALKTLGATFVGALLAFFANWLQRDIQTRSELRVAGNVALATLSRQYGDFVIAKAAIEADLGAAHSSSPQVPIWRAIQPTLLELGEELVFDYKSLAFLVRDGDDGLFAGLVEIQAKYHDLRKLMRDYNEAASQLQIKFSQAGWVDRIIPSEAAAEAAAGAALIGRLESLVKALANRVATHEDRYIAVGVGLERLMSEKFPSQVFAFRALLANKRFAKYSPKTQG